MLYFPVRKTLRPQGSISETHVFISGSLVNPRWGGPRGVIAIPHISNITRATGNIYIGALYEPTLPTHPYPLITAEVDGINMKNGILGAYNFPKLTRDLPK